MQGVGGISLGGVGLGTLSTTMQGSGVNPSNEGEIKPRSLRFTWSMKTTSSMDPNDMMKEIRRVLEANNCD